MVYRQKLTGTWRKGRRGSKAKTPGADEGPLNCSGKGCFADSVLRQAEEWAFDWDFFRLISLTTVAKSAVRLQNHLVCGKNRPEEQARPFNKASSARFGSGGVSG